MSTLSIFLSPKAKGLFHKVIVHSDPVGIAYGTQQTAEKMSSIFCKLVDCQPTDLACLKKLPVEKILNDQITAVAADPDIEKHLFQGGAPWEPYVDGNLLIGQPLDLIPLGNYNRVPVMIGSVNDEGVMFVYPLLPYLNGVAYRSVLQVIYGATANAIHQLYPTLPSGQDNRLQVSKIVTDSAFVCPIRNISRSLSAAGIPLYLVCSFFSLFILLDFFLFSSKL